MKTTLLTILFFTALTGSAQTTRTALVPTDTLYGVALVVDPITLPGFLQEVNGKRVRTEPREAFVLSAVPAYLVRGAYYAQDFSPLAEQYVLFWRRLDKPKIKK